MEPHRSVWRASPGSPLPAPKTPYGVFLELPRYGAASVSMASFAGVTTPGEANNCAPGSCQLPRPIRTPDACSISAVLWFHPDLQLLRRRMAFYGSYLVMEPHRSYMQSSPGSTTLGKRTIVHHSAAELPPHLLGHLRRVNQCRLWFHPDLQALKTPNHHNGSYYLVGMDLTEHIRHSLKGMESHRSVWRASPGSLLPGKRTIVHQAAASCPAPLGLIMLVQSVPSCGSILTCSS
ncbi:hypothetical protein Tco_0536561 [Tanacetum coccineum]